jgi:glycosyltransferase involved in cell wall biosynthesis
VGAFLEREEHVPASRIAVIPNFVDDDAFALPDAGWLRAMRNRWGVPGDAICVGIVANLHPIKDHALFLEVVARLAARWPPLHAVIVGDGICRAALETQAQALGITERVVFAGRLPNIPSPHHLFDVSVLTSRGEGFPNSVVEAMAASRPIVATAVGGVPDAVIDGATGLLVPPGDADRFTQALGSLIANPERRIAFGMAGRRVAEQRFHARTVLAQLETLYSSLLRTR